MAPFDPLPAALQGAIVAPPAQVNVNAPYAAGPDTTASTLPRDASTSDPTAGMQDAQAPQPGFAQVNPRVAAAQADQAHHSMLGRLVKAVMGTESTFEAQPDGSVVKVEKPQKPGQLFRGLLLSGILGAGTEAHTFGEGFAKGVSGAAERNIQNQDKQRAQVVQNEKLKEQKQKMSDEHAAQAQHLAMNNAHTLGLMYSLNTVPKEEIERTNQATNVADRELQVAGAKTPKLIIDGQDINGQVGSAKAWENAILKNPKLHDAPDADHYRVFLTTQNIPDGFTFDINKGGWVGPDGTPRDMHQYASIRAYDVPLDSLKQIRDLSGAEANAIVGAKQFEPDAKLHTDLAGLIALRSQSAKQALEAAQAKADLARAAREDALAKKSLEVAEKNGQTALASLFKENIKSIDDEIKERQKADPSANVDDLNAQRHVANQEFIDAVSNINPKVATAIDDAKKKQQEQADLREKARQEALKPLQAKLPKATSSGQAMTREQKAQFSKAAANPEEALNLAIKHGFDPYKAEPGIGEKAINLFHKAQEVTAPFVGVGPEKKPEESTEEKPTI